MRNIQVILLVILVSFIITLCLEQTSGLIRLDTSAFESIVAKGEIAQNVSNFTYLFELPFIEIFYMFPQLFSKSSAADQCVVCWRGLIQIVSEQLPFCFLITNWLLVTVWINIDKLEELQHLQWANIVQQTFALPLNEKWTNFSILYNSISPVWLLGKITKFNVIVGQNLALDR